MTLQANGTIKMSEVNVELGYSATSMISLGNANVRALLGVTSGTIALSDAYGKSSAPVIPTPGPVTPFTFVADWMMITYTFTDGTDLDTRTRLVQPLTTTYLGWGQSSFLGNSVTDFILRFGGDNTGTGQEAVLLNVANYKAAYPSDANLKIDTRGQWFGSVGSNPVSLTMTLWKGGTPTLVGYSWTNSTATDTFTFQSGGKQITFASTNGADLGERVAVVNWNVNTGAGNIDTTDTTTF